MKIHINIKKSEKQITGGGFFMHRNGEKNEKKYV